MSESKNLSDIIGKIEKLTVLELSELVKALEEKFGVSAMMPMAGPGTTGTADAENQPAEEEKDAYDVMLVDSGDKKINVIKAIRELRSDLGLKEAKDMSENVPTQVLEQAKKEEAEEAKKKLETAGAKVELK